MKTVLFFSPTGFMGGAETNLVRMCRYLTKNGYQCVVVLPPEGNLGQLCEEIGAKTVCLSAKKLQSARKPLAKILSKLIPLSDSFHL